MLILEACKMLHFKARFTIWLASYNTPYIVVYLIPVTVSQLRVFMLNRLENNIQILINMALCL